MSFTLKLLGKPALLQQGTWHELVPNKPNALLCYLAYMGKQQREQAAFFFYPEVTDASAKTNLRQLLQRIKKLDYASHFQADKHCLTWQLETDVSLFRQAIAMQDWPTAFELYDGTLLENYAIEAGGFQAWLELERDSLNYAWQEAAKHYSEALYAKENHQEAANILLKLLETDTLAEDVLQDFLKNAYLSGQRELAFKTFERFCKQLGTELGFEPLETTLELIEIIRQSKPLAESKPKEIQTHVPLSVSRPPELIGRTDVIQQIQNGKTNTISLSGDAGVGKTRILEELAPSALKLQCREGLQTTPYYPVIRCLQHYLKSHPLPDVGLYLDDLARLMPKLKNDNKPVMVDPESARVRLLEALARTFESIVDARNHVQLVIDDMQWADESTLALVNYLAQRQNLKILLAYRSRETMANLQAALSGLRASGLTEVKLEPLTNDDISNLLGSLIGIDDKPEAFAAWLFRLTGGNPFFALETLKALFEAGSLQHDAKGWHSNIDDLTRDYSELPIPEAIAKVTQRRLDTLSPETKRLLQTAAVIQYDFSPKLLSQVSGLSEWSVVEGLEEAESNGLVIETRFCHDLLRQSIYSDLSSRRKELMHAQVAQHLNDNNPAQKAQHWLAAGHKDEAKHSLRLAQENYQQRGFYQEAIQVLKQLCTLAENKNGELETMSLEALCHTEMYQFDEADNLAKHIIAESEVPLVKARGYLTASMVALHRDGQIDISNETLMQAEALLEHIPEPEKTNLDNAIYLIRSELLHLLGRDKEGLELANHIIQTESQASIKVQKAHFVSALHVSTLFTDFERAYKHYQASITIAKSLNAKHLELFPIGGLVDNYAFRGMADKGIEIAEEALSWGEFRGTNWVRQCLSFVFIMLERFDEAHALCTKITQSNDLGLRCVAHGRLAQIYFKTAQFDKIPAELEKTLAHLAQTNNPLVHCVSLIAILLFGMPEHREQAKPYLQALNTETLPGFLQMGLQGAVQFAASQA